MGEIGFTSAHQTVDYPDFVTAIQQQIHHVAADESGTTCYHRYRS
jgi:hypothetical protein